MNAMTSPPFTEAEQARMRKWIGSTMMINQHQIVYPLAAFATFSVLLLAYWLILA